MNKFSACVVSCSLLFLLCGCSFSVGASSSLYYPADKDPRKGYYDSGRMDGVFGSNDGGFSSLNSDTNKD